MYEIVGLLVCRDRNYRKEKKIQKFTVDNLLYDDLGLLFMHTWMKMQLHQSMLVDDTSIPSSSSGLGYTLHPLVLINISDHHTRTKVNAAFSFPSIHEEEEEEAGVRDAIPRVMGCLLGQQRGLTVDVSNSFEVNASSENPNLMDLVFLQKKVDQYKQTFPELDVVGWYRTGSLPAASDLEVQKGLSFLNEAPVFLLLDARGKIEEEDTVMTHQGFRQRGPDLPVLLLESETHIVDGRTASRFVRAGYSVATSEAERIGVDQVAKILPSGSSAVADQFVSHTSGVQQAIQALTARVRQILAILKRMKDGSIPYDPVIARQAGALAARLPAADAASGVNESASIEACDAMISTLLATMTKGTTQAISLVDKHNAAFEKQSKVKRMGKTVGVSSMGNAPRASALGGFATPSTGL